MSEKIKIFQSYKNTKELEDKVNDFILRNLITVISIQFEVGSTTHSEYSFFAMVVYK